MVILWLDVYHPIHHILCNKFLQFHSPMVFLIEQTLKLQHSMFLTNQSFSAKAMIDGYNDETRTTYGLHEVELLLPFIKDMYIEGALAFSIFNSNYLSMFVIHLNLIFKNLFKLCKIYISRKMLPCM